MANVLVVDDNNEFAKMVAKILRSDNHDVTIANEVTEALQLCELQKFDLIVTDILMPDIDGVDFIMEIHERNLSTPIIAMSGGSNQKLAHMSLQSANVLGVYSALQKPFSNDVFIETVRNALGNEYRKVTAF